MGSIVIGECEFGEREFIKRWAHDSTSVALLYKVVGPGLPGGP